MIFINREKFLQATPISVDELKLKKFKKAHQKYMKEVFDIFREEMVCQKCECNIKNRPKSL